MNVIEAGKAAGLSTLVDALSKTNHHYAISMAELERFTQIIRNQVLEEAAMCCDAEEKRAQHNMTCDIPKNHEFWNGGAMFAGQLAEEIRALKGANE